MNKRDVQQAKRNIVRCLTEDFDYGDGKRNQALFGKEGHQRFNGTDLEMIVDRVVLGLYFSLDAHTDAAGEEGAG